MKSLLIMTLLIAFASCTIESEWVNSKHNNKAPNWPIFVGIMVFIAFLEVLGFSTEMCYKKGLTTYIAKQDLSKKDSLGSEF